MHDPSKYKPKVDESTLNKIDRLGLAYCRLINFEWDDLVGQKPEGFDEMPNYQLKRWWQKKVPTKSDFVRIPSERIESIIGEANTSRCWWKFVLGESEEAWFQWYVSHH
jgi:hypothetical protein